MAKDYNITKADEKCTACGKEFEGGDDLVAALVETGEEFQRQDYCPQCWETLNSDSKKAAKMVGFWRSAVPRPQEKKKLFIEDELLINFFHRLEGTDQPARLNFRFILALILMRKRLLNYKGSEKLSDGTEVWKMCLKGSDDICEVTNPQLDEEKIDEVSRQLSEILRGQL